MPCTVLVVEDDDIVRDSTETLLSSAGFDVLVASNGDEALSLLEETEVQVLLTDVVMPGMSGTELAVQVRVRFPAIKIAFMTGSNSGAAEAAPLGPLMIKPIRAGEMIDEVTRLLTARPISECYI